MHFRKDWILCIVLLVLLVIVRGPSFETPLDTDSSANAFFARQMLRGETLYDTFHPAHHLPGIYYTFELAFRLFGDNDLAPRILLVPWALACAWLMYLMGRSFFDQRTGLLAALFFTLVSSQVWVTGLTVEMEHFANLPLIGGAFLTISLLRQEAPARQFIWVGMLGAICILYKVIFIAPLMAGGLAIVASAWIKRRDAGTWKTMLLQLLAMGAGLMLPLIVVAGYFASLGLWDRFMLIFEFGSKYFDDPQLMGGSRFLRPFGFPLFWISLNNIALLVFGLFGTFRLLRRAFPLTGLDRLTDFALAAWFIVSLALAGARGGGFAHYVLPVIPPLALMAAIEINTAYQSWQKTPGNRNFAALGAVFFVALIVSNFIWANFGVYSRYTAYRLDRISHDDFLREASEGSYISQVVATYLREHTTQEDRIYIWSIHVDAYYYADRLPPVDILWPSYISATGAPTRIFEPHTKYIVLDTVEKMRRPQWLLDGLATHYDLETIINGREIYRRR